MKYLYLISFLFLTINSSLSGQAAQMSSQTRAAIHVIQKNLLHNRSVPTQRILDYYPIYRSGDNYFLAALGKINASFDKSQAIRDGFDVGAIIGSIISLRIPLYRLSENFSYPGIEYIEVAEKIEPELDKALIDTRTDWVHKGIDLPQPFTGKNVLIGIVDWGFDYTNPMFFDTTLSYNRIVAAWDQVKVNGTPPPGFSHGAFYEGPDQLAMAQSDTFSIVSDYHGTHVAGIAGGSGGGTIYRGIGFEGDLLFSQMRQDASSSLDAFQWMYNMSQSLGRRLVINNSWGGSRTYPLDGTSLLSQAIDEFTELGVVFVFSAGNNGDINFHLKKTFNQDSLRTRIMGFNYSSDQQLWGQTVSMWGEPDHPFAVQLRILSDSNKVVGVSELMHTDSSAYFTDTFLIIGPDTVFYNFTIDAAYPTNGRPQMTLNIKSENSSLKKILYAEAESGTVHFWNTRLTIHGGGNWGYGFQTAGPGYSIGDKNYGIGHPGVTTSAITAAAHEIGFHLTSFSSYGPRMDDVLKPDISAPGEDIVSSFNSFSKSNFTPVKVVSFNGKPYEFIKLSGTSMSAPMITGAASLLLEADPTLSAAEVKEIIIQSARNDALTGVIGPEGHSRWGHGKLDTYDAIKSITGISATDDHSMNSISLFPNPTHDEIYFTGELKGDETYRLTRLDGTTIATGHFGGSLNVADLSNGIYILSIESKRSIESFRMVVAKN